MREIGSISNELDATVFRDYLFNLEIETDIESAHEGKWSVWVHDENRMDEAEALLKEFLENPSSEKFIKGSENADQRRAEIDKKEKAAARNFRTRADIFKTYGFSGMGLVTICLLALSVIATLLSRFGQNEQVTNLLYIAEAHNMPGRGVYYYRNLMEIREGQIWRLITPIFLHLGWMHIIFNMMWLNDLGSMIERNRGSFFLLMFVLITGALSNIGQFYMSGPGFGGMSGVIYGFLGYVWMQSRFNPWSGFVLHSTTVQMMLIWFLLCLSGFVGNIANTTHTVGLIIGISWGFLDARRRVPE